jgi:DNA polymerase III subunit gamma/tau
MGYQVLARKWRPQCFDQLVGQTHVVKALVNSLNKNRLHHAYLFTGTRGVGKTTIARLLAKALNCEQGISATPCLQCTSCRAIEQNRFVDLLEIDGASRTRVEDTREILENVQYTPTQGRFKIYLIDEVHMLSNHSFNALLKTLEEPPEHIKFILATTDPQKLPITVLSRCLQFSLKNLYAEQIETHLAHILSEEQINSEQPALQLIAKSADGSMRDGLSLLDQAIAYCDDSLKESGVRDMLGFTMHDFAIELLHALIAQDADKILAINQELLISGANHYHILDELLSYLHRLSVLQHLGTKPLDDESKLTEIAKQLSKEDTQLFYQIGIMGRGDISLAPTPAIGFDMVLLRMLAFQPVTDAAKPLTLDDTPPALTNQSTKAMPTEISPKAPSDTKPSALGKKTNVESGEEKNWTKILNQLKLNGIAQSVAQHAVLKEKTNNLMIFTIEQGHQSMLTPSVITRIESALSEYYQQKTKVSFESAASHIESPARMKQGLDKKRHTDAHQSIENDKVAQEITLRFDGKLVNESIKHTEDGL